MLNIANKRKNKNSLRKQTAMGSSMTQKRVSVINRNSTSHSHLMDLPMEIENSLMAKCEREQRIIDRFWGFEEEAENRKADLEKMASEDEFSYLLSQFQRSEQKKRIWEIEFEREKNEKALTDAINEDKKRQLYMKSFFQARYHCCHHSYCR